MRSALLLPALAGLAIAIPKPQLTNIDVLDKLPDPVLVSAPLVVAKDDPQDVAAPPVEPITTSASTTEKRDFSVERRDGNCAPQPSGSGPIPTPDTVDAFKSSSELQAMATNAPEPDGYKTVFTGLDGSLSASNYMGLYTQKSYDTLDCASKCDQASGCLAFNVYIERDPSLDPNTANCPNPPSTINFKCTLWGAPVVAEEATNKGQFRAQFQVLITGSNAYTKVAPPPAVAGYDGPTGLGGAINAPLDNGKDTYLGYQFFAFSQSQGYDPQTCADACNVQTTYNKNHPDSDGTYKSCAFFNAYVLSQNSIPQGLYCSLYSKAWEPSYATNTGQYRGNDRYTISRSYSYSLKNSPNPTSTSTSTPTSTSTSAPASTSTSTSSSTTSPTSTSTPCPSGDIIQNGSFEDGSRFPADWQTGGINYATPDIHGGSPSGGSWSTGAYFYSSQTTREGYSALYLSQNMNVCTGYNYSISYDYQTPTQNPNDCSLTAQYPYKDTPRSVTKANTGGWAQNSVTFQAVTGVNLLRFTFKCKDGINANVWLDNVKVTPYAGNAF